jgi:hypothetical protein
LQQPQVLLQAQQAELQLQCPQQEHLPKLKLQKLQKPLKQQAAALLLQLLQLPYQQPNSLLKRLRQEDHYLQVSAPLEEQA